MRLLLASLLIAGCASHPKPALAPAPVPLPLSVNEAVESPYRTANNRARDAARHPIETLSFFDIQPDATVIEIWPSSGWYTEILAPYLTTKGRYIAAVSKENKEFSAWVAAHPNVHVETVTFDGVTSNLPEAAADRILTFRNVHNWMSDNKEQAAFRAFFKALKPGGVLGVVEHRANPKKKEDPESGYVKEKTVIKLAQKAGFRFLGRSEANANSRDTKNYPNGVWTLPPSNKHDAKDDAKYKEIGESDRMTLKFMKPSP